jgi:hypothetical protein
MSVIRLGGVARLLNVSFSSPDSEVVEFGKRM